MKLVQCCLLHNYWQICFSLSVFAVLGAAFGLVVFWPQAAA